MEPDKTVAYIVLALLVPAVLWAWHKIFGLEKESSINTLLLQTMADEIKEMRADYKDMRLKVDRMDRIIYKKFDEE